MKPLLPIILLLLAVPAIAQRDRKLDDQDEYEAMIQHNINESSEKERREMAIQIARLDEQIKHLQDKIDFFQRLIFGSGGVAGGWKLISKYRKSTDDKDDSLESTD